MNDEQTRLHVPEEVYQYFERYHFTQSNRYRFLQAYKKWKSAFPDGKLARTLATGNSASELISNSFLKQYFEKSSIRLIRKKILERRVGLKT